MPGILKPARPHIELRIKFWDIRLDIQKWCAIKNIDVFDVQYTVLNHIELDDGEPDSIRSSWRTCGKNSAYLGVQIRHDMKIEALALVEKIK